MAIGITVSGAAGRMGRMIIANICGDAFPDMFLAGALEYSACPALGADAGSTAGMAPTGVMITDSIKTSCERTQIMIDFSAPASTIEHLAWCADHHVGMIIGTTGLNDEQKAAITAASKSIPVVFAPNMSLGVNLLFKLVEEAARSLNDKGYDIEIIEKHHRRKKDAPSGTAIGFGEAAARGAGVKLSDVAVDGRTGIVDHDRPATEIGFHAIRGGDIVGDHTVLFAAEGEMIELSHRATSRNTFAMGALRAAQWLADKPAGLYTMADVLGLNLD